MTTARTPPGAADGTSTARDPAAAAAAGAVGAAILVFVDCLKELPATLLLRPLNVETLATSIYQFASRGSFRGRLAGRPADRAASIGPVVWLTRFADLPSGPA